MNSVILRYAQAANIARIQYAADLFAEQSKVASVYHKSTLNNIFIEKKNSSSSLTASTTVESQFRWPVSTTSPLMGNHW